MGDECADIVKQIKDKAIITLINNRHKSVINILFDNFGNPKISGTKSPTNC